MEDETSQFEKNIFWIIGIGIILFIIVGFILKVRETTHLNDSVQTYEQFQELYNSCSKLNTDLCNMKALPNNDKMFDQFSKAQRINAIKTQLNRWVEDYNAKSKMWGKALWKSKELPYQLTNEQFSCNN